MLLTSLGSFSQSRFRLLEKVSPKSASRKAVQLWLTPTKYQVSDPERALLNTSSIKRIPFGGSYYQPAAETYYTIYSWGSGPTVLLLHDWGGSAAQVAPLAQPLMQAGFRVIAVDALAHGDSPGKQTDLTELIDIVQDIEKRSGGFHAIFAHSCSAIAAVVAIAEGVKCQRLVLSNPAASMDYYLKEFSRVLDASRETMGRVSTSLNSGLRRNIKNFSIINIVPNWNLPALVIHDEQNKIVRHTESLALAKLWSGCELYLTQGLGHDGVLSSRSAISKITDYVGQETRISGALTVDTSSLS